jgi:NitT/TauT family transport system substrate-binding protein
MGRVLVAAAFAWGLTAQAQTIKIRVGTIPVIDLAPFFAANDQGYFKQEGVELDMSSTANSNPLITQLAAGQLDIYFGDIVTALQAIENGIDMKVVTPGTAMKKGNDVNPCIVLKDGPIKSAKDLEGKRIAVNALNNIVWLYAREWLERKGVDLSKVRFVEVPFPQLGDALLAKQTDAACPTEPFFTRAMDTGKFRVLGFVYHETTNNLESVMAFAPSGWIKANGDAAERFARAYRRGVAFMEKNKKNPEGVRIIAKFTKMDPAVVAKIQTPVFPAKVDVKVVEDTARLMLKHGLLKKPANVPGIIHTTALAGP